MTRDPLARLLVELPFDPASGGVDPPVGRPDRSSQDGEYCDRPPARPRATASRCRGLSENSRGGRRRCRLDLRWRLERRAGKAGERFHGSAGGASGATRHRWPHPTRLVRRRGAADLSTLPRPQAGFHAAFPGCLKPLLREKGSRGSDVGSAPASAYHEGLRAQTHPVFSLQNLRLIPVARQVTDRVAGPHPLDFRNG